MKIPMSKWVRKMPAWPHNRRGFLPNFATVHIPITAESVYVAEIRYVPYLALKPEGSVPNIFSSIV